jgi:hypothetical protein
VTEMRNSKKTFVSEKLKGKDYLQELYVDWKMVFKETDCEVVDWIHLAHIRVEWLIVTYTVMNLRVP